MAITLFDEDDDELVDDVDEEGVVAPVAQGLTYFGTDFDVHGIVRRLENRDVTVPTFDPKQPVTASGIQGFQRRFVWRKPQMDRFIESLLLGYPVPGIFLVEEPNKTLLVLDGQQRLRTLLAFYSDNYNQNPFKLENVDDDLKGKTYDSLSDEARRALDNTFIHATIVRPEPGRDGHGAVYQLFERLNTGGTNLQPQEIRVALFHGRFVDLLRDLNESADWRRLYGKRSERLKDQELILRFFALLNNRHAYERPLKIFLNDYLSDHQDDSARACKSNRDRFLSTCELINKALGPAAFRVRRNLNAALADAIMVGLAERLANRSTVPSAAGVRRAHADLISDAAFILTITASTADEETVAVRLQKAIDAFASLR